MAALAWALRLRECLAPGSENHTRSNKGLHAKYAALICTAPLGEAVAMAHKVEATSNRRAVAAMRVGLEACVDRSIGIRAPHIGTVQIGGPDRARPVLSATALGYGQRRGSLRLSV